MTNRKPIIDRKQYVDIYGLSTPKNYIRFDNTLGNVICSMNERIFHVEDKSQPSGYGSPPKPIKNIFRKLQPYRNITVKHMLRKNNFQMYKPYDHDEILEHIISHKRKPYRKAGESLTHSLLTIFDSIIAFFVKTEKTENLIKRRPVPRAIQPRGVRYMYEMARYIKPMENNIYKAMADTWNTDHVVIKGMNSVDAGNCLYSKWSKFKEPVAVGLDASRFDQHCSVQALKYEHSFYTSAMNATDRPYLKKMLKWQLNNKGVAHTIDNYKVNYKVKGCRMTGDMNTALGNCILMCAMIHQYCYEHNIDAELANNGDDCVLFMDKSQLHKTSTLTQWFTQYGYTMKVEKPVTTFEKVEFCQTQPVYVPSRKWVMTRNPLVVINKDCICINKPSSLKEFDIWRSTVAIGGLSLNDGIPMLPHFYKALRGSSTSRANFKLPIFSRSGFSFLCKGLKYQNLPIDQSTRISFMKAFDIPIDVQLYYENYYNKCNGAIVDRFTINRSIQELFIPTLNHVFKTNEYQEKIHQSNFYQATSNPWGREETIGKAFK